MFKLAIIFFLSLSSILFNDFEYDYMIDVGSSEESEYKDHSQEQHHHFTETEFSHEENYEEVLDLDTLGKKKDSAAHKKNTKSHGIKLRLKRS